MNTSALPLTETQLQEFSGILTEIRTGWAEIKSLPGTVQSLRDQATELNGHVTELRRASLSRSTLRPPGSVTDDCALALASMFILHCARSDKLEALASTTVHRDRLLDVARSTFGITTRTALSTTEIPLPTHFSGQIRELTSEFGVVRRRMFHYPIGLGTARPARMGDRPAFGAIAMSAAIPEKSPTLDFASLESHKVGGVIRLPREIDEQSAVPMGHYLARYAAIEFARAEDTWGFLADGSATYEGVKGIVKVARDETRTVTLAAGKTHPSDATLDDVRALRRLVNKAALSGLQSAYYFDSTWETRLPSFRTSAEPNVYQRFPDGSAVLDGYPIVWTDVLQPYTTAVASDKPLAVFGALPCWWFGEHGFPRIDTSEHVFFANDQLAIRCLEEIDFDYAAKDATAALITAAA